MRLFVLAFVLGALGLQQAAALPQPPILPEALAALLCVRLVPARHHFARSALLLVAGGLAGYGIAAWRADSLLAHSLPKAWEGEEIELTGVISGLPQITESGTRFPFDVESVQTRRAAAGVPLAVPPTLALTWYAQRAKGDADAIPPPRIASGQRWHIVVRLKRPRGLANPHPIASFLLRFPAGEEEEGVEAPPNPLGVPPGLPEVPGESAGA